ncbi:class F sortase [Plantactinospora sonchi]|uniref:Class F sortase n=1 Tax=Plantactinospora sonchi TaxID=1544735 RepID=A0ABU7RLD6_9ACTN
MPDAVTSGAGGRPGKPWRAAGIGFVALLALVGAGLIGAALNAPDTAAPPQPRPVAAPEPSVGPVASGAPDRSESPDLVPSTPDPTPSTRVLPRSEPVMVSIPKIGVAAAVMPVGITDEGMVQVPPLSKAHLAGWYQPGPTPGEAGNSVIVGHVDSKEIGPAVFFRLGALLPGDRIEVVRKDGGTATFVVDSVKSYPKTNFPTDLVYGPSVQPGLRLVTCGGDFDERAGSYPDNIIAFARLAS